MDRKRDPGRYARSLVVSLALHGIVAVAVTLYILARNAPAIVQFVEPVFVTFLPQIERPILPPERTPAPEAETPTAAAPESPRAEPPKPVSAPTTFNVAPDLRPTRAGVAFDASAGADRRLDVGDTRVAHGATADSGPPARREARPRFSALERLHLDVPGEVVPVSLPEGSALDGDPTDVRTRGARISSRRGMGGVNSGGGGGGGGGGSTRGVYSGLMRRLARGVLQATAAEEVDVVFIVDTTHSMMDNVRGITAYADDFVNILRWDRRRPQYGLVTFSDTHREAARARGMTEDSGEFRNWLHNTPFTGGGDLAESGLDAVMTAVDKLKFRKQAHRYFVFVSDGVFHDRDYDGRSEFTLDEVIADLQAQRIVLDVVGIDYLCAKQLAHGTGGRWIAIPGKGYLEAVAPPLPVRANAALGVLSTNAVGATDELYVFPDPNDRPESYELRWRLLNPRGQKVQGEFVMREDLEPDARRVTFNPAFDEGWFEGNPGYYTAIYRITDSVGNSSVLRRVFTYQ